MLGLLVLLLISWGLLYLFARKNLNALGLVPSVPHLAQFLTGFALTTIVCLSLIGIETWIKTIQWQSQEIQYRALFDALVYHLRSALTEDLVFRGALLYLLIHWLGPKWAIVISALFFGCYHVFSYGITNERPILIIYVILVTGITGLIWAWVFHKTKSMYMGLGLHLGYNFLMACFYEAQPYGELLFNEISRIELSESADSWYSIFRGLYPSILSLILLYLLFRFKIWNTNQE